MEEMKIFENEELNISARTILNEDGSISINAEDTAIGFGWTQIQNKNGKQYTSIRWGTLNGYCKELGFPNKLGKDDYIPESLFYRLGMKASNARAEKFQNWLAMEVIPSIRKHGIYATDNVIDNILNNPDFGIKLLTELKEERERNKYLQNKNDELTTNNKKLDTDNKALAGEILDWADRDRINAGIRKLASVTGKNVGILWNELYKDLQYKYKIYLKSRKERDKNSKPKTPCLDYVRDNEWAKVLKVFCAMCKSYDKSPKDMMQLVTSKDKLSVSCVNNEVVTGTEDDMLWLNQL